MKEGIKIMDKKNEFVFVAFVDDNKKENKLYWKKISEICLAYNITMYQSNKKKFNYSFIIPRVFLKTCKQGDNLGKQFISLPSEFEIKLSRWDYETKTSKTISITPKLLSKRIKDIREENFNNLPLPKKDDIDSKITITDDDLPF